MPTCIYCRRGTNGDEDIDHPFLQALGMRAYPLPQGDVCNPCNKYLGQLDQNFCEHHHIAGMIVFGQLEGSHKRIRQRVTPSLSFDVEQQHLRIRARDVSIQDGCVIIRDAGNEHFDDWKFSRGLHRIAMGALALKRGTGQTLLTRYDAVRSYIREPQSRRDFWPYFQRLPGQLPNAEAFPDVLRGHGFKASFAMTQTATAVYLNLFVSEFVVMLDGNIAALSDGEREMLATAADTPEPHSARKWLYFDSAQHGERILLGPDIFRR